MHVVMTAAHAGWGSESVPVGGGGAVCERLCESWGERDDVRVTVLGTGPTPPRGVAYHRIDVGAGTTPPTRLSEMAYARLCRRFERACTAWIIAQPERVVVMAHDISEGPTMHRLSARGIPVIVLVHVDVVEYFTRMYLREQITPERAVALFRFARTSPVVPDVLRLVFDKQLDCAMESTRLVVPAPSMVDVLRRCYPDLPAARCAVVPWGAPERFPPENEVRLAREALAMRWGVRAGERLIVTLSRVSPEKGIDRLLEAIAHGERLRRSGTDVRVVICGGPAFMQGEAFMRGLRRQAEQLRTPVVFAGHLDGARKRAALEMADVFVAASRHESYGLTTMEAFAAGAPVVAVETHGSRATVDDACGRLVADGDGLPERLWQQLETLLRDDALRARLAEGARRRASRETFSQAAEALIALARECG